MKTYKFLRMMVVAISTLCLASCSDFLNMEPSNSSNADDAIETPADAQVAINGIMRSMVSSSYYGRNMMVYADAKGGDLTIYAAGRGLDGLYSFSHTASGSSYSGYWTTGYYCIMQINNLIKNITKLEAAGKTGFDAYKGQAYTLRALVYFDLVRLYGLPYNYDKDSYGVPNATDLLDADAKPGRATVAENYAQIIADLEAGEKLLEANKSKVNGYVGYYANIALQARVKLYMEDYAGALAAAKTVIDSGEYELYNGSKWVESWSKQYASESILEIGIDSESDLGAYSLGYYYMRYGQKKGAMGFFLASDYFLSRLGEDPTDVRWGVMDNDEYWTETGIERKGACYKYVGGTSLSGDGKETPTAVNIKVIRLSEIYLIAAEAALHTGDKNAAADYLNAIRSRAPQLQPATASDVSDDMILSERSKELFGEGHRFFDMIRMNKVIEYNDDFQAVPVSQRPKTIDRTFGKIVLPISQDELNANPTLVPQQNPAYK